MDVERIWHGTGALAVLATVVVLLLAIGSGEVRSRRFEDVCRRAGGFVVSSTRLSGSDVHRLVCARLKQPPILETIPLPGYTP